MNAAPKRTRRWWRAALGIAAWLLLAWCVLVFSVVKSIVSLTAAIGRGARRVIW